MKKAYLCSNISTLLLVLIFITACSGQSNSNNLVNNNTQSFKQNSIDELLTRYTEYGKFNGTVLVAEEGKVLFKKGFGLANMEWDIPNQTDTKFRLASITKQFTAMLILQLVAENKLDLHVPISSYLPSYPKKNADRITIHHLLTHTSGTPEFDEFVNYRDIERDRYRPKEMLEIFADGELQFTPGEKYSYTNTGYVVLGVIIEKMTGKSYEEVLKNKIFTPLGMMDSGYDHHYTVLKNRASGYSKGYARGAYFNTNYIDMSIPYAAGSIYATVEDLYLWDQALYTQKLLPKEYMNLLFDQYIPARRRHYGYGWFVGDMQIGTTNEQAQTLSHGGGMNGFRTMITRIPASQSSIIILSNVERAPVSELTNAIMGILYDKPYDPKKSIAYSLLDVIEKDGLSKGMEYYNEIKNTSGFYLDEHEMNIAGYELLQSDRATEAESVFKLNVEAFPNSFNVYDSYGEVLLLQGKKGEGIKNYQKSLALNPKNKNAIQVLKKLGVNTNDFYLVKTDSTWTTEIFTFPIHFAKDINYQGIEEAHFPKGWRKEDSPEFWSYVFAWNINLNSKLTAKELETNLLLYFDGLMKVVNKNKNLVPPKTIAKFHQTELINNIPTFTGTLKIYDAFVTKKMMTLNVLVEKKYCQQQKKSIILFKFSPKDFGHEIWNQLKKVELRDNSCEN